MKIIKLLIFGLLSTVFLLSACEQKTASTNAPEKPISTATTASSEVTAQQEVATLTQEEKMNALAMQTTDMNEIFADGDQYLAWFAARDNVIATESGLLYRVMQQGSGAQPTTDSVVSVHYRGTFPNREEFDSSYKRNEPTQFPVTGVIKGWTEALLLMQEGTKLELVIPPNLAYGERGAGNVIPPNQVLRFEVELLDANYVQE